MGIKKTGPFLQPVKEKGSYIISQNREVKNSHLTKVNIFPGIEKEYPDFSDSTRRGISRVFRVHKKEGSEHYLGKALSEMLTKEEVEKKGLWSFWSP